MMMEEVKPWALSLWRRAILDDETYDLHDAALEALDHDAIPDETVDAAFAHLPVVINNALPLNEKFKRLPDVGHVAACRSCFEERPQGAGMRLQIPIVVCHEQEIDDLWFANQILAALPCLKPELTELHICVRGVDAEWYVKSALFAMWLSKKVSEFKDHMGVPYVTGFSLIGPPGMPSIIKQLQDMKVIGLVISKMHSQVPGGLEALTFDGLFPPAASDGAAAGELARAGVGAPRAPQFTAGGVSASEGAALLALQASAVADSLRSLSFARNALRENGASALAPLLVTCRHLETLDLSETQLGAHGARVLAPFLASATSLRELKLAGSELGADGIKPLMPRIAKLTALQALDLSGNFGGPDAVPALEKRLPALAALRVLLIGGNNFGAAGDDAIRVAVAPRNLERFDISNPTIHEQTQHEAAEIESVREQLVEQTMSGTGSSRRKRRGKRSGARRK